MPTTITGDMHSVNKANFGILYCFGRRLEPRFTDLDERLYEASGDTKALALIKKMSPAAWRHIHLNGHYTFRGNGKRIDLDAVMAGLDLA